MKTIVKIKNFHKQPEPILGRCKIKNCNNKMTIINYVSQNRDHYGDIKCKTSNKANYYKN
jgi:hypothetical protein